MTAAMIDLGRRAVACMCWRWMPGMLTNHGARYLGNGLWSTADGRGIIYADPDLDEVPDLSDPATVGCVVALLRERWPDFYLAPPTRDPEDKAWRFFGGWAGLWPQPEGPVYVIVCGEGGVEATALVASLEHADRLAALENP